MKIGGTCCDSTAFLRRSCRATVTLEEKHQDARHVFCLIVGGGMSGITLATYFIKTKTLDYDEFRIIDLNNDYGGVWYANQYPGAACDVPSHAYQMRYFLKPGMCLNHVHDCTRNIR